MAGIGWKDQGQIRKQTWSNQSQKSKLHKRTNFFSLLSLLLLSLGSSLLRLLQNHFHRHWFVDFNLKLIPNHLLKFNSDRGNGTGIASSTRGYLLFEVRVVFPFHGFFDIGLFWEIKGGVPLLDVWLSYVVKKLMKIWWKMMCIMMIILFSLLPLMFVAW